jgi:hypothetical protein
MNHIKQTNRFPSFVRLQVADQMPRGASTTDFYDLPFGFLNAVLTEVRSPTLERLSHSLGRMRLADGNKGDFFSSAITTLSGSRNLLAHTFESGL